VSGEAEPAEGERRSRAIPKELRVALIVNACVVAIAAAIAVALIVIAWN